MAIAPLSLIVALAAVVAAGSLWARLHDSESRLSQQSQQISSLRADMERLALSQTQTAKTLASQHQGTVPVVDFRALQSGVASMLDHQLRVDSRVRQLETVRVPPAPAVLAQPTTLTAAVPKSVVVEKREDCPPGTVPWATVYANEESLLGAAGNLDHVRALNICRGQ